jgi:hypothetical protein
MIRVWEMKRKLMKRIQGRIKTTWKVIQSTLRVCVGVSSFSSFYQWTQWTGV